MKRRKDFNYLTLRGHAKVKSHSKLVVYAGNEVIQVSNSNTMPVLVCYEYSLILVTENIKQRSRVYYM